MKVPPLSSSAIQTEKGKFQVQPFGELPDLPDDQIQSCFQEMTPEDRASFTERFLRSLDFSVSLSPLTVELKGGATF